MAILLSIMTLPLFAQNNIYKIDDELFSYQQKCTKMIQQEQVLAMADTLFRWAGKKHDTKAQCLALHLKVDYHSSQQDITHLIQAINDLKDFARTTPHKQYIFSGWNRLITLYLRLSLYDEALAEIASYQKEALRFDNPYGIAFTYRHYGNVYRQTEDYRLAIEYYLKGADYIEKHGNPGELSQMFQIIGELYRIMREFDHAGLYQKKALETAQGKQRRMQPLLYLVVLYSETGDMENARKCLDEYEVLRAEYPLNKSMLNNYRSVKLKYYLLIKDYDRARLMLDSIPQDDSAYLEGLYKLYLNQGDYQRAFYAYVKYHSHTQKLSSEMQKKQLALYVARFDNTRLEAEKNRLALQNSEMRIRQLADERSLMEADKERDRLQLQAAELQLKNSDLALKKQEADLERNRMETLHQKERAAAAEERERMQRTITSVLVIFSGCLLVFIFIYAMQRRKSFIRLQKEKNTALCAGKAAEEARKEAEHAREVAEYASQQKSVFLQNMSHEIRTPLNAIVGFSDVLNSKEDIGLTEEERDQYLNLIHMNTELLTTLVNDVLDLSKLESGVYKLALEPVNISELCNATLRSIASRVTNGVELKLDEPQNASSVSFLTDAIRLQQVLTNFLTNACKYTDHGSITLGYRLLPDGGIEFSVTDTGCGVPADKVETIFGRFEKLNTFKQGTGLGLNICRRIAELTGGRTYVDTTYTGGARFIFIHPKLKEGM